MKKTLLTFALAGLVTICGFFDPAFALTSTKGNPDVPHNGDHMIRVANYQLAMWVLDQDSVHRSSGDSTVSAVILVIFNPIVRRPVDGTVVAANAGRVEVNCGTKQIRAVSSFLLSEDSQIIKQLNGDSKFSPWVDGSPAATIAGVLCGTKLTAQDNQTEI